MFLYWLSSDSMHSEQFFKGIRAKRHKNPLFKAFSGPLSLLLLRSHKKHGQLSTALISPALLSLLPKASPFCLPSSEAAVQPKYH